MRGGRLTGAHAHRAWTVLIAAGSLNALANGGPAIAAQAPVPTATANAPAPQGEAFPILEYRVLGNTVLDTRRVERTVYPHLGPTRTLNDVQAARGELEKAYRDAGYSSVFVDIPEQSVESGIVRLKVTE